MNGGPPRPPSDVLPPPGNGDRRRFRRVGWFGTRVLVHVLGWELLGGHVFGSARHARRRRLARAFCTLARELGGLFVKLGQYLSLRIDVLPVEVTEELAGLQDRMPAVPLADITRAVEGDLGRPLGELFGWFASAPVGCASLAQVHRARLHSGEKVVVKVLRPGTAALFEGDLSALARLIGWLKLIPRLRREIDLDQLLEEFTTVTRREMDLAGEGRNVERFGDDLRGNPCVCVPKVYWSLTGAGTLTMEDVSSLKVSDVAALDAAGISRAEVARQLACIYFHQIFISHFLHADPHPGNLFVQPLPHPGEGQGDARTPGDRAPHGRHRPFRVAIIDCGMAVAIPPPARVWLRDFVIGLGLRDARRVVQSYVTGGLLRPGVDVQRVEEMTEVLLEQFPEMMFGMLPGVERTGRFLREHEDLFADGYPFDIPMDLLFMYRALGLLGGVIRRLDPEFDLCAVATPFALRFLWEAWREEWRGRLSAVAGVGATLAKGTPELGQALAELYVALRAPDVLSRLAAPKPPAVARMGLSAKDRQGIHRLERSITRLTRTMATLGILALGVYLYTSAGAPPAHQGGRAVADHRAGAGLMCLAFASITFAWDVIRSIQA